MDALLDLSDPTHPREAEWPAAEFIVGNPPFLGDKLLRRGLGDDYVETLWSVFDDRLPALVRPLLLLAREGAGPDRSGRDAACRAARDAGHPRAGQPPRAGADQRDAATSSSPARTSRGSSPARTSTSASSARTMGPRPERELDGRPVADDQRRPHHRRRPHPARRLRENLGIAFMGDIKGGPFDIDPATAARAAGDAESGRSVERDVVRPWVNGLDVDRPTARHVDHRLRCRHAERRRPPSTRRPSSTSGSVVRPVRDDCAPERCRRRWWLHARAASGDARCASDLDRATSPRPRLPSTGCSRGSRPRCFPISRSIVFARDDDYTFGVLHSRVHEAWARGTGHPAPRGRVRLPLHPDHLLRDVPVPAPDRRAARGDRRGRPRARPPPRRLAQPARPRRKRSSPSGTLTNLYNARPTWLANAHADLDAAVLAAYGWPADLADDEILARLLALNLEREPVSRRGLPDDDRRRSLDPLRTDPHPCHG